MRAAAIALFAGVMFAALGAAPAVNPAEWRPTLQTVASPAGENSAQPQLTVSPRGVLLSWIARRGTTAQLMFAERTANGWSTPRIAASGDNWFVNWADVPSVLRLSNGTVVAHWLQKSGAGTYAYDVRLAYSRDDGATWAPSFTPHHDGTQTEHGFASLFETPQGGLGLIWLDGRQMAGGDSHDSHGSPKGAMTVGSATFDTAWKQTSEFAVDTRVCECCPTTAVMTADGPLVAYRDRSEGEIRDIAVSRFENGTWTPAKPVHADNWKIAACPVNGPMLSARGRQVAIAWFTAVGDVGRTYVAFSSDAGRTFGAPIRLDQASATGRVDLELLADGSAVATWIEFANERSTLAARRIDPTGRVSPILTVTDIAGSRASGYPRVALDGRQLVFAWTETTAAGSRVRTATAPVE